MTVWSRYARCDECGVDAGLACRDLDDREALEVCDGRELVIERPARSPRIVRTGGRDRIGSHPRTIARRRAGIIGQPQYAPCQHCGTATRLLGRAVDTGVTWCDEVDCQRAKRRRKDQRRLEAIRAARPAREPVPCAYCGDPVVPHPLARAPYACGEKLCRSKHERHLKLIRRAGETPPPEDPERQPCPVCGGDLPRDLRPFRIYCGRRCRNTAKSRRHRSRQPADPAS